MSRIYVLYKYVCIIWLCECKQGNHVSSRWYRTVWTGRRDISGSPAETRASDRGTGGAFDSGRSEPRRRNEHRVRVDPDVRSHRHAAMVRIRMSVSVPVPEAIFRRCARRWCGGSRRSDERRVLGWPADLREERAGRGGGLLDLRDEERVGAREERGVRRERGVVVLARAHFARSRERRMSAPVRVPEPMLVLEIRVVRRRAGRRDQQVLDHPLVLEIVICALRRCRCRSESRRRSGGGGSGPGRVDVV